jgi:cell division protein ZapE
LKESTIALRSDRTYIVAADFAAFLEYPVSVEEILSALQPPIHFKSATLANFIPDPLFPAQHQAVESIAEFALLPRLPRGFRSMLRSMISSSDSAMKGLYLDGGFGVGKTHLLAAAYHAREGVKSYLSFQELMFLVGLQRLEGTYEALRDRELLLIDEFELDDPANTRIASKLFGKLFDADVRIITTSNTPPGALGEDKFSTADFARELQDLADRFIVLRIDGEDYRIKHDTGHHQHSRWLVMQNASALLQEQFIQEQFIQEQFAECTGLILDIAFSDLLQLLSRAHPIRVRSVLTRLSGLLLRNVTPIEDASDALRFVYFIDKAYDQDLKLSATSTIKPSEIFAAAVVKGGDRKKFLRTISRLTEMVK